MLMALYGMRLSRQIGRCIERPLFLRYNELHPSEQSDRVVAREIAKVLEGKESDWVNWLS